MNGYLFFQLFDNISSVDDYLRKDFGKILKSSGLEARRWMKNTDSSTSRVYDRNLEEIPVTVDFYGDRTRIVDYSDGGLGDETRAEIEDIVSRYLYVEKSRIVYVVRKKREGREQHEKGEGECPVTVRENGLVFECELEKYADTGLFLDMEETRAMVREMAKNQRVLNLFSYTASFSVYAASAPAESVTSVDLSNVYSQWGRRNLSANGFLDENKYSCVTMDVRKFVKEAARDKKVWDLVIIDPPAFSNSHKAEDWDVQKDHAELLRGVYDILSDGGVVLFSENLQGFRFEKRKLDGMYEPEELTSSLYALNFSHKRKSCRVWLLRKNSGRKRERKERKMSEELERFSVNLDDGREEGKRERKEARSFSFDDNEKEERAEFSSDDRKGKGCPSKKSASGRGRRDEREFCRDGRKYGSGERDTGGRDRYSERSSSRCGGREDRRDRYSDRENYRDSYRDRRDRCSDREERPSRYSGREDRRDRYNDRDSYSDRRDRYSDREERSSRYSDRNDGYRGGRSESGRDRRDRYSGREEHSSRYSDRNDYRDRRDRYSGRDERREYRREDPENWRDGRDYSKKEEHSSFARRESDGSRSSYKRSSYSSRDSYSSSRDGRRDRDGRKKSSPKPFGYDSFMANKNRQGATADWLKDQEYIEKNDD